MSDQENKSLTIVCSKCAKETEFTAGEPISDVCDACQDNFYGKKYTQVKYLSAGLVVLSSMLGGYAVNEAVTETRLPALAEYRLMNLCINGDSRVLEQRRYSMKEETCSCIVTKAVEDIDITWKLVSDDRYGTWLIKSMREASTSCQ